MKRLLVVSQRFWPENEKITDMCLEMVRQGIKVDVLCGQPNYPRGRFFKGYHSRGHRVEKHGGIRIFRATEWAREDSTGYQIMGNYLSFKFSSGLRVRKLKKIKYDAVLVYQTGSIWQMDAGLSIGRKQQIPVTTYVTDLWPQCFFQEMDMRSYLLKSIFAGIARRRYLKSDRIIAPTEASARFFLNELQLLPSRVTTVPLCPDQMLFNEEKNVAIMEKYAGSFKIVWAGEFWKDQDFDTLLETGLLLAGTGIRTIRIIMVGKSDSLSNFKRKTREKKLEDIFFFEDVVLPREYIKYMYMADALLGCRITEGRDDTATPFELINYMAIGKPLLIMSGGPEKKMVRDIGCGYSCEPGDAKALFECISKMSTEGAERRAEMGKAAREYVDKNMNLQEKTSQVIAVTLTKTRQEIIISKNSNIIKLEDDEEEF